MMRLLKHSFLMVSSQMISKIRKVPVEATIWRKFLFIID